MKRYQLAIDREIDRSRSRMHARESEQLRLRQPPLCIEHSSLFPFLPLSLSLSPLLSYVITPLSFHTTKRARWQKRRRDKGNNARSSEREGTAALPALGWRRRKQSEQVPPRINRVTRLTLSLINVD